MNILIVFILVVAAFAFGWLVGIHRNDGELEELSDALKKATDSLADSVKKNQP